MTEAVGRGGDAAGRDAAVGRAGAVRPPAVRNNTARVLRLVHEDGPITRAELTRRTGLNRSTTLAIVGELVERGLVHEEAAGTGPSTGLSAGPPAGTSASGAGPSAAAGHSAASVGRPSPVVRASADVVAVAVTVEVDAVTVALVGLDGSVRDRAVATSDGPPTAAEAVETIAVLLDRLVSAGSGGLRVVGIGVAVPGTVRVEDGVVRYAPHLGWHDEPVAGPLAARTGLPVRATNDANTGAWAERLYGSGRGVDDLIYLNGGASGIGGGVISAARPLSGAAGYAGELGHTFVAANGIRCHCGAVGCLETEASRDDLVRVTGVAADDPEALAAVLAERRPEVERVVDRQVAALATALRNAIHTVNPEVVVLGGFLGVLFDHVGDRIETAVREQSMSAMTERLRIAPAALGADVLLRGAAEIGFRDLLRDPTTISTNTSGRAAATNTSGRAAATTTTSGRAAATTTSGRAAAAEEARPA
ncbi:ROK family transcriptional regulator [Curtobacterium sp. MCPF17_002]|uniref:ROK family transcriptional regulator n=1 Tax=Curtobacterium sp. MCPF17_002 TaxID=2175645 RepID=UPI0021ACB1EE|nr:ROK family transcriptional regulator [Curtobacterium sp. MCPF17_002]WIB78293.1 ROK family transcriptional regulator [Curtobacterium sp. MCPF17_002]